MEAKSPTAYIDALPEERKKPMKELRQVIRKHLPKGFKEVAGSMIGYVVPYSMYPAGYHCPPPQPLPFISIASQKNFIALYHFGIYTDNKLLKWFTTQYPKYSKYKLDMGKSCIRFKKVDQIPHELIGQLVAKMTPQQWITTYEKAFKNTK